MSDLDSFRTEVRSWLEDNCPESMRTPMPEEETVWGGRGEISTAIDHRFEPGMSRDEAEAKRPRWAQAVERARGWAPRD